MGSVTGSAAGTVAGSSRRTVLSESVLDLATTYGDEGPPNYAQQVAEAAVAGIHNRVEDAHTENVEGMTSDVRQLSMIEEEESVVSDAIQLQDGAGADLTEANLTAANLAAAALERDRTYTMEVHKRKIIAKIPAEIPAKSWSLLNIFKWASIMVLFSLLFADIYRGPLFGSKYDLLRWRSDVLQVSKNASNFITADIGMLARRFDTLEHQFQNLPSMPRTTDTHQPKVQKINWFSPGLGAITAPSMSSPTKLMVRAYKQSAKAPTVPAKIHTSWLSSFLSSLRSQRGYEASSPLIANDGTKTIGQQSEKSYKYEITEARSLQQALLPWHDVGDCWCAPSTRGKLQLAVMLPRKIYPTELVVEHVPKGELHDIGNAPKEVELWIQILDENTRREIGQEVLRKNPDAFKEISQRGKGPDTVKALDETFLPIGRWTYDIKAANHVQSFAVPVDLSWWVDGTTIRAVFRANSNWGSTDSTCIYRVKLHGKDPKGVVVYNDLEEM